MTSRTFAIASRRSGGSSARYSSTDWAWLVIAAFYPGSGYTSTGMDGRTRWRAAVLCAASLSSFAANSILCRLALRSGAIAPAPFTAIRLFSGALLLAAVVLVRRDKSGLKGDWTSGAMLWLYAAAFSFAYTSLGA